ILIVGDAQAQPIRWSLSRGMLCLALTVTAVVALVQAALIVQVMAHVKEARELHALRNDITTARQQTAGLLGEMSDIKRQIRSVKGPITSGFGERLSPFSGEPAKHNGVDIGAPTNTPIIAPAMGTVVAVRYDVNMGNVVKIDHGFDFQTEYRHLEKVLVRPGQ